MSVSLSKRGKSGQRNRTKRDERRRRANTFDVSFWSSSSSALCRLKEQKLHRIFPVVRSQISRAKLHLNRAGLVDKTNNIIDKRNDGEYNTYQIINVRHTGRVDLLIQHRVPLAQPSVEFRDAHIRKSEEIELLYNEVFETKSEAKLADESVTLRGRRRRRRRKRRTKRRRKRRRASKRVFSGMWYQCAFVRV